MQKYLEKEGIVKPGIDDICELKRGTRIHHTGSVGFSNEDSPIMIASGGGNTCLTMSYKWWIGGNTHSYSYPGSADEYKFDERGELVITPKPNTVLEDIPGYELKDDWKIRKEKLGI